MKKKIIVKGPALSRSGYGEQTRFALRCLRSREDIFDIYILNIPWGQTGQIAEVSPEHDWINSILLKTTQYLSTKQPFDLSLQVTIPLEFEKMAPINIGYTAGIETTRVSPSWIERSNERVDKIITISQHAKTVFENSKYNVQNKATGEKMDEWGLQVPIEVVNYPVKENSPEPLNIEFTTDTNFLVVSQWGIRKNIENTIKWFVEEFRQDENVGLVLKMNSASDSLMDREFTTKRLRTLLDTCHDYKCKIYLIHGDVKTENLTWLYQHPTMKALINIAHGEGYGLPLFEAAYNGLPLVTITWGGQLDFICKKNKKGKLVPQVASVDYTIGPVQKEAIWEHVIEKESMWAYAKESSYKRALRDILEKEKHYKLRATGLQKTILKNFSAEKIRADFISQIWEEPDEEVLEWLKKIEEISEL